MNDVPENELLGAYLDGELTAVEQARVERMLAADPAARQLLDESAPLSATLQDLPQQTLGEDLGDRVLQLAERRILTESQLPAEPVRPIANATTACGQPSAGSSTPVRWSGPAWPSPWP